MHQELIDICRDPAVAIGAQDLVPPPRFSHCSFEGYRVDPAFPEQTAIIAAVQAFARRKPRRFLSLAKRQAPGLYLDGGFGVGKTHLLAAAWHAAPKSRRYLGFAEAISLMIVRGPAAAIDMLAANLVCIDEFELDDPSNTRLIDLLLDGLVKRGSRIIVTSNTVPEDLGAGRFPVEDFKRQLQRIAAHFTDILVPGQDFRRTTRAGACDPLRWGPLASSDNERCLHLTAVELDRLLADIPIVNLRRFARLTDEVLIDGLVPFPDQFSALRFVHLIDRLYDYRVSVRVRCDCAIDDIFLPSYRDWAFARKYRRCCSRLHEICAPGQETA